MYRLRFPFLLPVFAVLLIFSWSFSAYGGAGAEIYNELLEKDLLYTDNQWDEYVEAVGARLLDSGPYQSLFTTITVVDTSMVNAFATRDGYIFVHRGILALLNSEDELAALLGHEIAHVALKHHRASSGRSKFASIVGWISAVSIGAGSLHTLATSMAKVANATYGREAELDSDAFSLRALAAAGYDPSAKVRLIEALGDHVMYSSAVTGREPTYHGLLSSHPQVKHRVDHAIREGAYQNYQSEPPLRDFLVMLKGLRYGDQVANGAVRDNVWYSGPKRFKVVFPEGWEAVGNAIEASAVLSGDQSDTKIRVFTGPVSSEEMTGEQYLKEVLKRDDVESSVEFTASRYRGALVTIATEDKTLASRRIAVVFMEDKVVIIDGVLALADTAIKSLPDKAEHVGLSVDQFDKLLIDMGRSVQPLVAKDIQFVNSQRIDLMTVEPGVTYEQLGTSSVLLGNAADTLRLINGHYPGSQPRPGDLIKIIR